jgi:cytochrome c oxidase subunit 2
MKCHRTYITIACVLPPLVLWSGAACGWWSMTLPERDDPGYRWHLAILWICAAAGLLTYCAMFWSIIHYRRSRGADAGHFHPSLMQEILWAVVPLVILAVLAYPAARALIGMGDPRASAASASDDP